MPVLLPVAAAYLLSIVCCSLLRISSELWSQQEHRHWEPAAAEGEAVARSCLVPYVAGCIVRSILRASRERPNSGVAGGRI
jgi:hypothetical protein